MNDNIKAYSEQLKKLGIENSILEHPVLKTPPETLGYLGLQLSAGVSTLVMKSDDTFIAVLRRDDCKVNFKKIKEQFHISDLRIATHEEFSKLTGLPIGAARVFIPQVSKTLIDKRVLEKDYLIGGSGNFTSSIKYKTSDLQKLPNCQLVDVCVLSEGQVENSHKRVLSGIRATGRLHLGNYLGAIKGMLALQDDPEYETFYMVADLHAVTTPYDVEELRKNRREVIIDYLAAGLDPQKSVLFQQAANPHHAELAFYLSSVVTIAKMQHLPTFKDKVKQYPQHSTMALLNYPILMTSDILLYKASSVPVGVDQEPHLEVAREIARRMNQEYSMDFPEPQTFKTTGEYVPSLTGEGKMSKSVEGSFINLTDDRETIKAKLAKAPSDSGKGKLSDMSSGVSALLMFVRLFQGEERRKAYVDAYQKDGIRYGDLKKELAEAIFNELKPIQEKRKELEANSKEVDKIIEEGNQKATEIASGTIMEVKEKMGLL